MLHSEGSNLMVAYANSRQVRDAILNLEFFSTADLYMTPTAELADIILPAAHWLETDDIYDMHPRFMIEAINSAVVPAGESWPDNRIYNELGRRVSPEHWFESVEEMLDYQLRKADIKWKDFKKRGILARTGKDQPYYKQKTDIWKKNGGFPTNTGKVELYSTILEEMGYDPLPYYKEPNESPYSLKDDKGRYPLILSTGGRIAHYFHSQYRQIPWLRQTQASPMIQIHPETASKLNIKEGDWVWIETPRGKIKQKAKLFEGMDPRVVVAQASWWYPELPGPDHGVWESNANLLTSNDLPCDPCIGSTTLRALMCRIYRAQEDD